jgi:hypothetical protein
MQRSLVGALFSALVLAAPVAAQKPAPKDTAKAGGMAGMAGMAGMDHSKMGGMDHAAMHEQMMKGQKGESWKELDAYHALMMATWHPAKDSSNLAPFRARAAEMVAAAKTVAASKAPASCGGKAEIVAAQKALPAETEKAATLAAGKTSDADLKAALKGLHDKFEVLEMGCGGMEMKGMAPKK